MNIKLNKLGFSAVELLLILAIVGIIGGVSFIVWNTNNNSKKATAASHTKKTSIPINTPITPKDWLSYKSKNSSIIFNYPSDWSLATNGISNRPYSVEGAVFTGPNNFTLTLDIEKIHVNTLMCTAGHQNTAFPLPNKYFISVENTSSVYSIFLSLKDTTSKSSCSLGFFSSINMINKDLGFFLQGSYLKDNKVINAEDYLKKPEVIIAKQIFESFSY